MPEHTNIPWIDDGVCIRTNRGRYDDRIVLLKSNLCPHSSESVRDEFAALILTAVNAHERLVEDRRKLIGFIKYIGKLDSKQPGMPAMKTEETACIVGDVADDARALLEELGEM